MFFFNFLKTKWEDSVIGEIGFKNICINPSGWVQVKKHLEKYSQKFGDTPEGGS